MHVQSVDGGGVVTKHQVLVSPEWLEGSLNDPRVRVVEVDVSPRAFAEGHIPGAVLWNIYRDLRLPDYSLADASAVEALIARCGITPGSTVVFYGYGPALGFWLMKLYGHDDVRILDCSWVAWQGDGRP